MISALIRRWNTLEIAQLRTRQLPHHLERHFPRGSDVLDIGSGNGEISRRLLTMGCAASIHGVDVLAHPDPLIPTVQFDGEHLPYEDASFDLVTLLDVLHHTRHPERLLAEAARVSRGRVLIKDHYWATRLDRWILMLSDYLGNKPYGVSLPYAFLRMEQWERMFSDLALNILSTEQFRYASYDWSKQVVFVVEPDGSKPPAPSGMTRRIGQSAKPMRAGSTETTSPSACTGSP